MCQNSLRVRTRMSDQLRASLPGGRPQPIKHLFQTSPNVPQQKIRAIATRHLKLFKYVLEGTWAPSRHYVVDSNALACRVQTT